jgi:hypothetical protein
VATYSSAKAFPTIEAALNHVDAMFWKLSGERERGIVLVTGESPDAYSESEVSQCAKN